MGIPLHRGRLFTAEEIRRADPVVLVNRSFADALFAGVNPVGRRLKIGGTDSPWRTIVGVVGDARHRALDAANELQMYHPMGVPYMDGGMSLVVKTAADASSFARAVRQAVWSVDPNTAIVKVATLETLLAQSTSQRRFALVVFEVLALVALALAAAGIFGVLAASVAERTREIGVRTALGTSQSRILGMVVRQGLALTVAGLVLGLAGAYTVGRLITKLLYGTQPHHPVALLVVSSILAVMAMLACVVPAWRAAKVDPVIALREG